ncbi:MAG: glycoside hydrolase family 5 protein [Oscillospiraceae bacterium]|nr:glycoside hydrolase family 5 protein [Oscillospiraceae bacterium]
MKNKLFAIALMAVAAITILAAPILDGGDGIKNSGEAQTTTASVTTSDTSSATTTSDEAVTTTASQSDEPTVTTTTTEAETESATTTTTTSQTTTEATTTTTPEATTTTTTTTAKKPVTTTTTTKKPQEPVQNDAPSGTPVAEHGQLSVKGANIVDQSGNKFQLIGMSTHGLGWFPKAVSKQSFKVFRDDWNCNAMRLAMYIEESWGGSESLYLAQPETNYQLVTKGVDACIDLGMYVIVDWHVLNPGDPTTHTKESKEFFGKIAKEYGDYPNIIYEICNEPNGNVSWSKIKTYADEVIAEIRKYDSDAVIICGTPTWSQDIDKAKNDRLSDKNTVYALHFYANTHTDWLRDRLTQCYNAGLPVLVSEFGTCDASGNGGFNKDQTKKWLSLLDSYSIGYFNWSFCDKGETASAFKSGTDLSNIKAGTDQLTESGKLIRELFLKRDA